MNLDLINKLKQRLTGQSIVLDIGFGTGRISFSILSVVVIPQKIIGVESRQKQEVEKDYSTFLGPGHPDTGIYGLRKSDGTIDLFDYYKYLASGLNSELLDYQSYNSIVNVIFNKKFQDFIEENENHFNLIVLFNVLHYSEMGDPKWVLNQIKNILTEKGLILISFKNYKHSKEHTDSDRQEINVSDIIKYLDADFKILFTKDCEEENSTIYLGERNAPQQKL